MVNRLTKPCINNSYDIHGAGAAVNIESMNSYCHTFQG